MKQKTIEANGFVLRSPRAEDASFLAKYLNDSKVSKNLSTLPYPYDIKDADAWLKTAIPTWNKKRPEKLNFMIEIDNEVAGSIGLENIEWEHKAELGY